MNDLPIIPGYKIERELGQGGMATVYLGVQEKLNRKVAIKVLEPLLLKDQNFARRFLKEAETAANLHHSYIITIHDVGQSGNLYYMAVEYLPGGTLKERLRRAALPPAESLQIIGHLAEALEYAHGQGFVHRDIKPENVMFRSDGRTVLTDFGIARAIGSTTRMTKTGQSIGTPHYMSPEQARGQAVDGRSDIYSLGILFYEMLTGHVPYDAEDSVAVVIQHLQNPIPTLPAALYHCQPLLDRMMAKDQGQRFQNCRELLDEISRSVAGAARATPERPAGDGSFSVSQPAGRKTAIGEPKDARAEKIGESSYAAPLSGRKRSLLVPELIGALAALVAVLFWVLGRQKADPQGSGMTLSMFQQTIDELRSKEIELSRNIDKIFKLISEYRIITGGDIPINAFNKNKLRLMIEKGGSAEALLILSSLHERNSMNDALRKKIHGLENKMPDPHIVEKGDTHFYIAKMFLMNEKKLSSEAAERIVKEIELFEPLVPGFKVWNYYSEDEGFVSYVSKGTAPIAPEQIQRRRIK